MQLALALLADPALDVLITGESDVRGAAAGDGATWRDGTRDALCHRIRYEP